jgi:arginase
MSDRSRPELRLVSCPYDCGLFEVGMGRGPTLLLSEHLPKPELEALGWRVTVESVEPVDERRPEIARVIELDRRLAERVRAALVVEAFPLVLAGNCISCLGTTAGVGADEIGVVWLDAHADFDTPEDNVSGFFDVMGLAVLTGSGWRALRETIPGFRPVDEDRVVLAAVRDLEPYQRARLEHSRIRITPSPPWREDDFDAALDDLRCRVESVYLHIDLDALDPSEGTANEYVAPGGLTIEALLAAVRAVFARFSVSATAVTAYDPAYDEDGQMARRATMLVRTIAEQAISPR